MIDLARKARRLGREAGAYLARWRDLRRRLAARDGARVPIVEVGESPVTLCVERVVSVDTTASGGNAQLLALGD